MAQTGIRATGSNFIGCICLSDQDNILFPVILATQLTQNLIVNFI